ncbi:O-antigen ligase family protein [Mesorhizobium sp. B2-3-7]|nr:O-antigen ligase family protein [Mesorhizobium sp. B2-3-8]TPM11928.1 O-antigen ligase family protein [Mesorhizobium sp. B2-3-7]
MRAGEKDSRADSGVRMNYARAPRHYWTRPGPKPAVTSLPEVAGRLGLWFAVASVFLTPFNILRFDAFYFTISDGFALAAVFAAILGKSFSISPLGAGTFLWNIGIALLCGMLLLSSLIHGDPQRGFIISAQYLYAYFLLAFMIVSRPWAEIVLLMKSFLCSIAVMCLQGIVIIDILKQRGTVFVSGNGRFQGWVERENECATLIALSVPLMLWLVASGCIRPRWLWVGLPLFGYGIILTGSNTGLIGLVFAVTIFVVATGSWRRIISLAVTSLAAFFIAVTWGRDFLPEVFQHRVLNALQNGDLDEAGTFADRMRLIHEAIGKADNNSLLGIGADQYRQVSELHAPVHNTYLLIWVEAGLPGFIGFLLLLVAGITIAILAARSREGKVSAICTATTVLLFAALANALPHLYSRFFLVPLLLGMAPSVAILRDGPASRTVTRFLRGTRSKYGRSRPFLRRPI